MVTLEKAIKTLVIILVSISLPAGMIVAYTLGRELLIFVGDLYADYRIEEIL